MRGICKTVSRSGFSQRYQSGAFKEAGAGRHHRRQKFWICEHSRLSPHGCLGGHAGEAGDRRETAFYRYPGKCCIARSGISGAEHGYKGTV